METEGAQTGTERTRHLLRTISRTQTLLSAVCPPLHELLSALATHIEGAHEHEVRSEERDRATRKRLDELSAQMRVYEAGGGGAVVVKKEGGEDVEEVVDLDAVTEPPSPSRFCEGDDDGFSRKLFGTPCGDVRESRLKRVKRQSRRKVRDVGGVFSESDEDLGGRRRPLWEIEGNVQKRRMMGKGRATVSEPRKSVGGMRGLKVRRFGSVSQAVRAVEKSRRVQECKYMGRLAEFDQDAEQVSKWEGAATPNGYYNLTFDETPTQAPKRDPNAP